MKFDMGRAWNDAVALLRGNGQVVLVVAGVFFFLPYLALILLLPDFAASVSTTGASEPGDPGAALAQMGQIYGNIWWALLLMAVIQGIGMLGLLALLTDRNRPTVGEALAIGAKCFLPYLAAQILQSILIVLVVFVPVVAAGIAGVGVAVALGLVAAVAVAYIATKFSLTVPVIVVDGVMNPVRALGRSWSLTKGNSVRLFFFYVLLVIALLVIAIVLGIIMSVLRMLAGPEGALIVNGIVNGLVNMIAVSVFLAVLAAVHRQLAGPSAAAIGETFE